MSPQITDRAADAGFGIAIGTWSFGFSIAVVNQWLQALVFVIGAVSGVCAARYYWVKANEKTKS